MLCMMCMVQIKKTKTKQNRKHNFQYKPLFFNLVISSDNAHHISNVFYAIYNATQGERLVYLNVYVINSPL